MQLTANRYIGFVWTGTTTSITNTLFNIPGVVIFEYSNGNPKSFNASNITSLNSVSTLTQWKPYLCFTTTTFTLPSSIAGLGLEP